MGKNSHPPRKGGEIKKQQGPKHNDGLDIVFSNAADGPKKSKSGADVKPSATASSSKGKAKTADGGPLNDEQTKRPDTRTLIGGPSWTGKLPMTLLSEHCQKQKWDKPEYTMVVLTCM